MSNQSDVVTVAQAMEVRSMAIAKGIGRRAFQQGLDDSTFAIALDAVKQRRRIALLPLFEPPAGGRIHIVRVPVVLDRPWDEAVRAAGSNTPDNYDVWKVGDLYPPTGQGQVKREIILLNFGPNGGNWDEAQAWAEQYPLKPTVPRSVFAIGEHCPGLHRKLNMDPMYVVATQECAFEGRQRACRVWWCGTEREALLNWVGDCGGADDWFAFSRE